jgi:excisionase family DNA binding protein
LPDFPNLRLALSPAEAAEALGVSVDYLDEHIAPELRWVRHGRRKFVSVTELERWLEQAAAPTLEPAKADANGGRRRGRPSFSAPLRWQVRRRMT